MAPKTNPSGLKIVKSKGRRQLAHAPKGYEPRPAFIDYKDVNGLRKFLTSQAKLMSRKRSGLSAGAQRALAAAVKRARFMGLLPYVGE
ncbi:30S ribosomal protein S18 [Gemmata obscuriglobus]|uniref:Small ribosomal subunit protein bS18 n=2 Tax=Gemmata TaxID=113 RepID=A0A2Z3H8L1_9BACT|nr:MULTISPECIES: 30S ribosomal protein S18 [Gemmata]AWM39335.1 30S ribosomal protein S18 [Gemmata obscuriglobus]MDY3554363.1 30S ribosomal protein S18 [Gemmata algarum]MDY3563355.1 30S ribosomal protein S18 [Gemmata algarum]QEG27600.1 30S ribosomal protein S18 [Gemmata obscuriglobus]VTS04723.1 30s ribosomal protein s18 : 30S ribosomal protein S18 OS=Rhodopirellula sp. SWK7 GN=rpsR PE=3 SV=1: Ribosomal_S18 [Gemmata obscuriglobus UQM 2246]